MVASADSLAHFRILSLLTARSHTGPPSLLWQLPSPRRPVQRHQNKQRRNMNVMQLSCIFRIQCLQNTSLRDVCTYVNEYKYQCSNYNPEAENDVLHTHAVFDQLYCNR